MIQGRKIYVIGVVIAGVVAAGCSSGGSSSPSSGSTTTTSAPAEASAVSVDLTITGDRPATIKGSKGRCDIPSSAEMPSNYEFSGADYPSLGPEGNFSVAGVQKATGGGQAAGGQNEFPASIKAVINGGGFLDTDGAGITFSADRKKVTLDADLSGSTGGTTSSPGTPLNDHVSGTITCS
jgi:hypothetical protein